MNETSAIQKNRRLAKVERILVATKYRFIGDTLLAVPLIRAAKRRWPDASISLLTGGRAHELLMHCPYIDEFIEFDPYRPSDEGFRRFIQVVKTARSRRFDLALVCNRSFHSALIAALTGARERVGWSGFQGRDFLLTRTTPYDFDAPEAQSYLDLLRAVAPDAPADTSLELWVTPDEREEARPRIPSGNPLIGLQPGASHEEKRWPAERYAQLAERLLGDYPCAQFLLVGGPDERAASEATIAACSPCVKERMVSLAGELSLRGTLAAVTYLDLFVSGDTAIRHAAVAVGVPSVALFGPTSVKKWGNAAPPLHAAPASGSGRVSDIPITDVYQAAVEALDAGERRKAAGAQRLDERCEVKV